MRSVAFLLLLACQNEVAVDQSQNQNPGATGETTTPAPDQKNSFKISAEELENAVDKSKLVQSPVEMEKVLAKAGISSALSSYIPKDRDLKVVVDDKDQTAVRTGVVLSDLVLTVKVEKKENIIKRLDKLSEGSKFLGAGGDVQSVIVDLKERITSDAVAGDELLSEFEELSMVMVPELEYEAGEWVVPLIQAGTWLEGAHLVSSAMLSENKTNAADQMFRQRQVVEYFISYVKREGTSKAPNAVITKLTSSLEELKVISGKPSLTKEDVQQIKKLTGDVLSML